MTVDSRKHRVHKKAISITNTFNMHPNTTQKVQQVHKSKNNVCQVYATNIQTVKHSDKKKSLLKAGMKVTAQKLSVPHIISTPQTPSPLPHPESECHVCRAYNYKQKRSPTFLCQDINIRAVYNTQVTSFSKDRQHCHKPHITHLERVTVTDSGLLSLGDINLCVVCHMFINPTLKPEPVSGIEYMHLHI